MNILIVEDEPIIARRLRRLLSSLLPPSTNINICHTVTHAQAFLDSSDIDVLFLDLNLHGDSGFDLLQEMVSHPFHTIVVSANTDRALEAFEYGVLDFIPKPFDLPRIQKALSRLYDKEKSAANTTKYLSIQKRGRYQLLEIEKLAYVQGAGIYTELYLMDGTKLIHNKSLDRLGQILPENFDRIHRSYIINRNLVTEIIVKSGGKYLARLQDGTELPISRNRYRDLKEKWII